MKPPFIYIQNYKLFDFKLALNVKEKLINKG